MLIHEILSIMRKVPPFIGYSTEYTSTGTQGIDIPAGASTVTVEGIGGGEAGVTNGEDVGVGGGGGAYSKRNTYSVAGLSQVWISVPTGGATNTANGGDAEIRENNSSGTVICLAKGGGTSGNSTGGQAASGTGDVTYSGGNGGGSGPAGGGGAAGPSGAGSNGTGAAGGASGGSPAGAGGFGSGGPGAGANYGGGGGASTTAVAAGAQGWVKLTWA